MHAPVAGRRKGLAVTPTSGGPAFGGISPPASALDDDTPPWLSGGNAPARASGTASAASGQPQPSSSSGEAAGGQSLVTPPQRSADPAAVQGSAASHDLLSFLGSEFDFLRDSGKSIPLPARTPSGNVLGSGDRSDVAVPSFLQNSTSDEDAKRSSGVARLPHAEHSHTMAFGAQTDPSDTPPPEGVPLFLTGESVLLSAEHPGTGAASPQQTPPPTSGASSQPSDSLQTQWQDLQQQLSSAEKEMAESEKTTQSLQSGSHALCREVEELKAQSEALRVKASEALENQTSAREARARTAAEVQSSTQQSLEEHRMAIRKELESEWDARLKQQQAELDAEEASLLATKARVEEMESKVGEEAAGATLNASAVDRLKSSLLGLISNTRQDILLATKPLLARHIRDQLISAAEQRRDIMAADAAARKAALDRYQDSHNESWTVFRRGHGAVLAQRRDQLFGKLKASLEASTQQQVARRQEEMSSYVTRAQQSAQELLQSTNANAKQLNEAVERARQDSERVMAMEIKTLTGRKDGQLQLFRERASAEKRTLLSRVPPSSVIPGTVGAAPSGTAVGALYQFLNKSLDDTRVRLDRVRSAANSELAVLQSSAAMRREVQQTSCSLDGRPAKLSKSLVDGAEDALHRGAQTLRVAISRFRGDVSASEETVRRLSSVLRERRVKLDALHSTTEATRRAWERDVRHGLRATLCSGSGEGETDSREAADLRGEVLTDAVCAMAQKATRLTESVQRAQAARHLVRESLASKLEVVAHQRQKSDATLGSVFGLYESLQGTATTLEGLRRVMELASVDVCSSEQEIARSRAELREKQVRLEKLTDALQRASRRVHRDEEKLRRTMTQQELTNMCVSAAMRERAARAGVNAATGAVRAEHSPYALTPTADDRCESVTHDGARSHWVGKESVASPSPCKPVPNRTQSPDTLTPSRSLRSLSSALGTEFSTSLVPLDDDSTDELAVVQATLALSSATANTRPLWRKRAVDAQEPTAEPHSLAAPRTLDSTSARLSLSTPSLSQ